MKMTITFAAALGVLIGAPLSASAQQTPQQTQQQQQQKKKPAAVQKKQQQHQQRVQQQQAKPKPPVVQQKSVTKPPASTRTRNVTTTTTQQKGATTTTRSKTVTTTNNKPPRQVTFSSNRQTFAGTKARAWSRNGNWNYRGRNYSYWRGGPYRYRYNNTWRTYVALSALTAIAVGSATYYPYAYVSAPQEVCEGITEDGCQLTWTEAETLEGGVAPVCVTYCPWQ